DAESIIEHAVFRFGGLHKDYSQHGYHGCYNEEDWYYYDPGACNTVPYRGTIRLNKASPTLRNNEILFGAGYAISIDVDSEPTTSGNTVSGNAGNGVEIRKGTVTGAVVRTWANTDMVYVVTGYLTYEPDTTLVIQPGVKVKVGLNKLINIQGILKVQGTSGQSVIFTSFKDDTVGGDTNNDGDASQPAPGDWGHINFADSSNDAESIIEHAVFRFGGLHKDYSQHGYHGCYNEEDWYYYDP
ncbi:MAG: hypothetical protein GY796_07920, partial [Chloroflexi bacterium]|nr:hypothetical protein [Chloroflexota bacterium]